MAIAGLDTAPGLPDWALLRNSARPEFRCNPSSSQKTLCERYHRTPEFRVLGDARRINPTCVVKPAGDALGVESKRLENALSAARLCARPQHLPGGDCSARPCSATAPRSRQQKCAPASRWVRGQINTAPGSASACRRAARFGASPMTVCSVWLSAEKLPHDDGAGRNADASLQRGVGSRPVIRHGIDERERGAHRLLGVVLLRANSRYRRTRPRPCAGRSCRGSGRPPGMQARQDAITPAMSCGSAAPRVAAPTRLQNITVNWRRSASSGDTTSVAVAPCAPGREERSDGAQHLAAMLPQDTELREVPVGQIADGREVDGALGQALRVPSQPDRRQPLGDGSHDSALRHPDRSGAGPPLTARPLVGDANQQGMYRASQSGWLRPTKE